METMEVRLRISRIKDLTDTALEACRRLSDRHGEGKALVELGNVRHGRGGSQEAVLLFERAVGFAVVSTSVKS